MRSSAETYRARAREIEARAEAESNPWMRQRLLNIAAGFQRLADQVDGDGGLVIDFELPPEKPTSH